MYSLFYDLIYSSTINVHPRGIISFEKSSLNPPEGSAPLNLQNMGISDKIQ